MTDVPNHLVTQMTSNVISLELISMRSYNGTLHTQKKPFILSFAFITCTMSDR
jgi:hypothetical protein